MDIFVAGCGTEDVRAIVARTVVVDGEMALLLGVSGEREWKRDWIPSQVYRIRTVNAAAALNEFLCCVPVVPDDSPLVY